MLKSNVLLNLRLNLRPIHNSLHSEFVLMFCLSFFLKGRHFLTLHKRFCHQIEKQEEISLYLTGPTFLGHLYVVTLCIDFLGKSFAISYWCKKYCNTHLPGLFLIVL